MAAALTFAFVQASLTTPHDHQQTSPPKQGRPRNRHAPRRGDTHEPNATPLRSARMGEMLAITAQLKWYPLGLAGGGSFQTTLGVGRDGLTKHKQQRNSLK
jgi:hypothetical protein